MITSQNAKLPPLHALPDNLRAYAHTVHLLTLGQRPVHLGDDHWSYDADLQTLLVLTEDRVDTRTWDCLYNVVMALDKQSIEALEQYYDRWLAYTDEDELGILPPIESAVRPPSKFTKAKGKLRSYVIPPRLTTASGMLPDWVSRYVIPLVGFLLAVLLIYINPTLAWVSVGFYLLLRAVDSYGSDDHTPRTYP